MSKEESPAVLTLGDLYYDIEIAESGDLIAGVDEAGRGPLAGPVVAAAVILDPNKPIEGLRDSKKLSEKERDDLAPLIKERALAWCVAHATVEEIEKLNILQATLLAMTRAVDGLPIEPKTVLVDGNRIPKMNRAVFAIIKGDDKVPAISAASIIAKTTRDGWLTELDKRYPEYGFAQHKGYGTKQHLDAIRSHGILPIHRKTFAPIAKMIAAGGRVRNDA